MDTQEYKALQCALCLQPKGTTIRTASMIMDIILLMIIQQSQSTTLRVNFCRKHKQNNDVVFPPMKNKPNILLEASLESFKDAESAVDEKRILYEKVVGPHKLIIKNIGLKDFYPTTKDTKLFKLPRKRKVRVIFEIQWLLTSMIYHVKVANVLEKDFSFRKIEDKVKVLAETWKLLMFRLGVRTKRKACYRQGFIPKMNTRREVSKHSSIVLRDIHCTLGRLIQILSNCRIRKKKNRKSKVTQYIFTCGKGVKSVFYNRKSRISSKFLPNHCEIPKKMYSLSQL